MNYLKSCLIITMLLGVGYSLCNESNWQEYYPDMAGCDLFGASLSGANLFMANLNGASLEGANLSYANLLHVNFEGADLSYADLSYADLAHAYLYMADLSYANLEGANLHLACLESVIGFTQTNYIGQPTLEGCVIPGGNGGDYCFGDANEDGYDDVSYEAGANSADPCYGVVCDDDPEMICICGECGYEDEQGDTGGDGCDDCEMECPPAIEDGDADGFDDGSFDSGFNVGYGQGYDQGAQSGDLNLDGGANVLDVVMLVDNILNP